jgi:predicted lipoprotein with Yx(FWY)xxD motif
VPRGIGLIAAGLLLAVSALSGCTIHPTSEAEPRSTSSPDVRTGDDDGTGATPLPPTVVVVRLGAAGQVLADASGFTVYTFSADRDGSPHCKGECAKRWRPVTSRAGKPKPGTGVAATAIGSIRRDDGTFQVTFNGMPLYQFAGDTAPGQENGSGRIEYGGSWSAAPPPRPSN